MKLDPRIIEGKKPFDCVDAESETVKSFIGKKGYFADHISEFIDISDLKEDVLTGVNPDAPGCEVYKATCTTWEYFLPKEWVKEPEKKYRPFTNEEFLALFDSGKLHSIRKKNEKGRYIITDVYFNDEYEKGTIFVKLNSGGIGLAMRFLVNNGYEYFNGKDWQPFGVEIEE